MLQGCSDSTNANKNDDSAGEEIYGFDPTRLVEVHFLLRQAWIHKSGDDDLVANQREDNGLHVIVILLIRDLPKLLKTAQDSDLAHGVS